MFSTVTILWPVRVPSLQYQYVETCIILLVLCKGALPCNECSRSSVLMVTFGERLFFGEKEVINFGDSLNVAEIALQ